MNEKKNRTRILVSVILMVGIVGASIIMSIIIRNSNQKKCWDSLRSAAIYSEFTITTAVRNNIAAISNMSETLSEFGELESVEAAAFVQSLAVGSSGTKVRLFLPDGYAVTEYGVYKDVCSVVVYDDIVSDVPYVSKFEVDPFNTDRSVLNIYCPVVRNGEVVGMMAGIWDYDMLYDTDSLMDKDDGSYLMLIDSRDGKIFYDRRNNIPVSVDSFVQKEVKGVSTVEEWTDSVFERRECSLQVLDYGSGYYDYIYMIPASLDAWMVAVGMNEKEAFRDSNVVEMWLRLLIVIELLGFIAYILWIMYDIKSEISLEIKAAEDAAKVKAEEEVRRVINTLAEEYICVFYVQLRENWENDVAISYRESSIIQDICPGWSLEKNYKRRLDLLVDSTIYEDDKEEFIEATKRENIIKGLEVNREYTANARINYKGGLRYYQMKFIADKNEFHELKGLIVGIRSIDEEIRKEIENRNNLEKNMETIGAQKAQLEEQQILLERASQSKTTFLFNMSHDIRTPMNAIVGFTNLAKKNIDNTEKVKDYLEKIDVSGQHLLKLINEVLDMSRIESGKLNRDYEPTDVYQEAYNLMTICRENAQKKGIELVFRCTEDKHVVYADKLHVNQVVMNIISNAIKYTNPGGRVIYSVEEEPCERENYIRIRLCVEDNGIGMKEEFIDHIFDSFSREKNTTVSGIEGTGLGMAIVKKLVEFMDGTININSKVGVGTKVEVVLECREYKGELDEMKECFETYDFAGRNVLLVEDNDLNREIATELLSEEGIVVDEAINGAEAVSYVRNKGVDYYDCILMDIQMPVMNGYEACAQIRKFEGGDKIAIIALSANAFEEDRQASFNAGMNEHIAKPINIKQLFEIMAKYLNA